MDVKYTNRNNLRSSRGSKGKGKMLEVLPVHTMQNVGGTEVLLTSFLTSARSWYTRIL